MNSASCKSGIFLMDGCESDFVAFGGLIEALFSDDEDSDGVRLFEKVLDMKLCESNEVIAARVEWWMMLSNI